MGLQTVEAMGTNLGRRQKTLMKLDIIDNYSGMFMIHRKNMNRKSTV
jgi:uncharacterized protein Veg